MKIYSVEKWKNFWGSYDVRVISLCLTKRLALKKLKEYVNHWGGYEKQTTKLYRNKFGDFAKVLEQDVLEEK